jgi:hypothetical protein
MAHWPQASGFATVIIVSEREALSLADPLSAPVVATVKPSL